MTKKLKKRIIQLSVLTILVSSLTYMKLKEEENRLKEINYLKIKHKIDTMDLYKELNSYDNTINNLHYELNELKINNEELNKTICSLQTAINNKKVLLQDLGPFIATAYDLSVDSCSKKSTDKGFGVTKSGYSLKHKNWSTVRTIAVDPKVIPLGTKLYIEFEDENMRKYNGLWTARDTGSAIKNKKIDFYIGDGTGKHSDKIVRNFGKRNIKVYKVL